MDNVYELKYKSGPHGDACTTYDLIFNKEDITLREFVKNVIERNPQEWGTFYVSYRDPELVKLPYVAPNEQFSDVNIEYKYGKLITTDKNEFMDRYIVTDSPKKFANGGWSCMNFWITLKD